MGQNDNILYKLIQQMTCGVSCTEWSPCVVATVDDPFCSSGTRGRKTEDWDMEAAADETVGECEEVGFKTTWPLRFCPEFWFACGCTWDNCAKGGASWGDWTVFRPTPRPRAPPSLEAIDATIVSRLAELVRMPPSWQQLLRARPKAWVFPGMLCLAPTIWTGMCGGWGGCAVVLTGGGAGRIGGGFLEDTGRGSRSVLGWIGTGPLL